MRARLVVFMKMPVPGRVKTRLCPPLAPESAARCYRALARDVWASVQKADGVDAVVALDDAGAAPDLFWLDPQARGFPQPDGDLGRRLSAVFAEAFAEGRSKVIVIGSDAPELSPSDLEGAARALDAHDAVLGPALDGGYYLIGLRRPCGALFTGIDWSTGRVLEQTLAAARAAGLSCARLRPLADIDAYDDLVSLAHRGAPPFTRQFLVECRLDEVP